MHPIIHVKGDVHWRGEKHLVEAWLRKWGLDSIITGLTETIVIFDGAIPLGKEGPNGRVKNNLVQNSLEELADQVEILQAAVRCWPSYPNDEHDIIFVNKKFVKIHSNSNPPSKHSMIP